LQGQHSSICPTPRNAAYADSLAPRSGVAASPAGPTTATVTGAPDYPSPPTGGEAAPSLCCACTAAPALVRAGQRWRRQAPTHCLLEPSSETAEQRSGIADCSGHRCCRPHTRHGHTAHDRRHALSHLPQERPRSATEAVEAAGATKASCPPRCSSRRRRSRRRSRRSSRSSRRLVRPRGLRRRRRSPSRRRRRRCCRRLLLLLPSRRRRRRCCRRPLLLLLPLPLSPLPVLFRSPAQCDQPMEAPLAPRRCCH